MNDLSGRFESLSEMEIIEAVFPYLLMCSVAIATLLTLDRGIPQGRLLYRVNRAKTIQHDSLRDNFSLGHRAEIPPIRYLGSELFSNPTHRFPVAPNRQRIAFH